MNWALRFGVEKGVVSIDDSQVCLKSLANFHDENSATFLLRFVTEIRQRFALGASLDTKCYSHQAFDVRILQ